jgi:hypothetical protein
MILIEFNSTMSGVQYRIFVLRVLFGLVTTQSSHANDGATELVLAAEAWCCHRVMLVTTLPSHAGDGVAKSVLAVTR